MALVATALSAFGNDGGSLLPSQLHKSQWTLDEQQKWASHWLSARDKSPKITGHAPWRHDRYAKSRKKCSRKRNMRKKSRYELKQYIQEFFQSDECSVDFMDYPGSYALGPPDPRFMNVLCNREYSFTHSLSTLKSFAPDFLLGRTLHLTFSQNSVPILGQLTCVSHLGFIRLQHIQVVEVTATHKLYPADFGDLIGSLTQNAYWFHYDCIGRVLLFEEDQKRYVDITAMLMDLMKFKIVQWLKSDIGGTLQDIEQCVGNCGVYSCSCRCPREQRKKLDATMYAVVSRFEAEQQKVNCHALLLKYYHEKQLNQMRFGGEALEMILRGYVGIGGRLTSEEDGGINKKEKGRKGLRFMEWDEGEVARISKKRCKRRC